MIRVLALLALFAGCLALTMALTILANEWATKRRKRLDTGGDS